MTTNIALLTQNMPVSEFFTNPEIVKTIKNQVAKGATDEELMIFGHMCSKLNLNPFLKEVWFCKSKNADKPPQIMVGLNGYWTTANRQKNFVGYEADYIIEKGIIIGAWFTANKLNEMGTVVKYPVKVFIREFKKESSIWNQMPNYMIMKVAESHGLRRAFAEILNGTYTEFEMPEEFDVNYIDKPKQPKKVKEFVTTPSAKSVEPPVNTLRPEIFSWGYKPLSKDDEEGSVKIKTYLKEHAYFIDKEKGVIYLDHEVKEFEIYCVDKPCQRDPDPEVLPTENTEEIL